MKKLIVVWAFIGFMLRLLLVGLHIFMRGTEGEMLMWLDYPGAATTIMLGKHFVSVLDGLFMPYDVFHFIGLVWWTAIGALIGALISMLPERMRQQFRITWFRHRE